MQNKKPNSLKNQEIFSKAFSLFLDKKNPTDRDFIYLLDQYDESRSYSGNSNNESIDAISNGDVARIINEVIGMKKCESKIEFHSGAKPTLPEFMKKLVSDWEEQNQKWYLDVNSDKKYKLICSDDIAEDEKSNNLHAAEQQIFGWNESHRSVDLIDLIQNMSLKDSEWSELVSEGAVDYLPLRDIRAINDHFAMLELEQ